MIRKLWTDEKPKQSGYYWLKDADGNAEVVEVKRGRVYTIPGEGRMNIQGIRAEDAEGKWSAPVPFPSLHRANQYEGGLRELTQTVVDALAVLDAVMREPSSPERGSKVAKVCNVLNYANDRAMMFALGMSNNEIDALKRKRERIEQANYSTTSRANGDKTAAYVVAPTSTE